MYEFITHKLFNAVLGTFSKFISNIPQSSICMYFGFTSALRDLNTELKSLENIQNAFVPDM